MQPALHLSVKILPGDKVEIQLPPGSVGELVDVFVILPEKIRSGRQGILDLLEDIRRRHAVRSVEEIDRDLQAERNSWDN